MQVARQVHIQVQAVLPQMRVLDRAVRLQQTPPLLPQSTEVLAGKPVRQAMPAVQVAPAQTDTQELPVVLARLDLVYTEQLAAMVA